MYLTAISGNGNETEKGREKNLSKHKQKSSYLKNIKITQLFFIITLDLDITIEFCKKYKLYLMVNYQIKSHKKQNLSIYISISLFMKKLCHFGALGFNGKILC